MLFSGGSETASLSVGGSPVTVSSQSYEIITPEEIVNDR